MTCATSMVLITRLVWLKNVLPAKVCRGQTSKFTEFEKTSNYDTLRRGVALFYRYVSFMTEEIEVK